MFQALYWLRTAGQEDQIGRILVIVLVREITPLLIGIILLGRGGTATVAELGMLKSGGEIAVLRAEGIDIFRLLVLPRAVAFAVASFTLGVLFVLLALVSGFVTGRVAGVVNTSVLGFLDAVLRAMMVRDLAVFPAKLLLIGMILALVSCATGLTARETDGPVDLAAARLHAGHHGHPGRHRAAQRGAVTARPVLALEAARGDSEHLPQAPIDLALAEGDFALIETPGPRRGAAFADLCAGLVPLTGGRASLLGRDWSSLPAEHADALRGHVGRLFSTPIRPDTPDVAARILLARLHHTRIPEADLRAEAATLAVRFGLPGLPAGPAQQLPAPDLLRAACVRAFLGQPRLVILELPAAVQQDDLLAALLDVGAVARGERSGRTVAG